MGNNRFQHILDADSLFGGDQRCIGGINANDFFYFQLDFLRPCTWQVDFIQYWDDFQIFLQCQVDIGQGLGLHPLGGIHDEHRPFTGRQTSGYFIGEIDMPRGVNQIKDIIMTVLGLVKKPRGLQLDGDAPFPFQIHIVQILFLHVSMGNQPSVFNNPVRQS